MERPERPLTFSYLRARSVILQGGALIKGAREQGSKEKGMKGQMDGQVEDFEDESESMKK